jgi:hypothetical protein
MIHPELRRIFAMTHLQKPLRSSIGPSFRGLERKTSVRIYELVGCGLFGLVVGACSAPRQVPVLAGKSEASEAPNVTPEEATTTNAGASRCSSSASVELASTTPDAAFAVGFGEKGGFVAWSAPSGIRGRALDAAGRRLGREMELALPIGAKPIEIAPLGRGFVVVAQRVETKNSLCEGRCLDATCSGWPAGTPAPHICKSSCPKPCVVPVHHEFFMLSVDLSGKTIGDQTSWVTGLVNIEAILHGDGRSLGILTGSELVWVQTDVRLGAVVKREPLPSMAYALPVRGRGKPSLLAVAEDGSVRLVDTEGDHALQGTIGDARSGRILDARLQARWDSNDRLHIAKQAWMLALDAIQYSYVENGVVLTHDAIERGVFRAPFAEYVEPYLEGDRFRRRSWLQRSIGEDIDLRAGDPEADVRRAQFVWTGKTFLFVYPLASTPQNLRAIVVDCSDPASKPS